MASDVPYIALRLGSHEELYRPLPFTFTYGVGTHFLELHGVTTNLPQTRAHTRMRHQLMFQRLRGRHVADGRTCS